MVKKFLLVILIVLIAGVIYMQVLHNNSPEAPSAEQSSEATPIQLPEGKATLKLVQRKTTFIPGSNDKVRIYLSDVTSGQVEVTVTHEDGHLLFGPTSMKEGNIAHFRIGAFPYSLTLLELHNKLLGGDYVVIEITAGKAEDPVAVINKLIEAIETADITFIRNGSEHTPDEAAAHVRRKWNYIGSKIKTPEDFIKLAASKSSTSGKPYQVKLKDGTTIDSAVWLTRKLEEIRHAEAEEPQPATGS